MQRRVNFLVSALGSINTNFEKASETIDVDVDIIPYMIDNVSDKVSTAVSAVNGGIWSRREGIIFAGNMDRIDEELKEIEEEQAARKNTGFIILCFKNRIVGGYSSGVGGIINPYFKNKFCILSILSFSSCFFKSSAICIN